MENYTKLHEQILKISEIQHKQAVIFQKMADTDSRLLNLLSSMMKAFAWLFFITDLLIWRVFFWDYINDFFTLVIKSWGTLTEGYKILILGLIGGIPSAVIASVISSIITEKIKKMALKSK